MTASKFPDLKYTAVGSFIFLRFICPAITSPAQYGILEGTVLPARLAWLGSNVRTEAPPPQVLRGFVLVAKVIQNTVNGVMFSEKEPYMMKLNKYMEKALPEVSRFLEQISQRVRRSLPHRPLTRTADIECECTARGREDLRHTGERGGDEARQRTARHYAAIVAQQRQHSHAWVARVAALRHARLIYSQISM